MSKLIVLGHGLQGDVRGSTEPMDAKNYPLVSKRSNGRVEKMEMMIKIELIGHVGMICIERWTCNAMIED